MKNVVLLMAVMGILPNDWLICLFVALLCFSFPIYQLCPALKKAVNWIITRKMITPSDHVDKETVRV